MKIEFYTEGENGTERISITNYHPFQPNAKGLFMIIEGKGDRKLLRVSPEMLKFFTLWRVDE